MRATHPSKCVHAFVIVGGMKHPQTDPNAVNVDSDPQEKRKRCLYTGCRKLFTPKRPWQKFCPPAPGKPSCKDQHHNFGDAYGHLTKRGTDRLVKESSKKLEKELPKLAKKALKDLEARVHALEKKEAVNAAIVSDLQKALTAIGVPVTRAMTLESFPPRRSLR